MEYRTALTRRACVHRIVVPYSLIIIHMHYKKTVTVLCCIPSRALTVLQNVELILVIVIIYNVSIAAFACRFQIVHLSFFCQLYRSEPSGNPFFVCSIS